jgi:hypothetical protein
VCLAPSCTVNTPIITATVAPYVDGRDLYYVMPMCVFTGNTTIPVSFSGTNYQRCSGAQFQINLNFGVVDAFPQLIATAKEGFDVYNNGCQSSQFWVKRNGCSGYNCSATVYFAESSYYSYSSPFTYTCPSGQSWYTGVYTSSGNPAPDGCYAPGSNYYTNSCDLVGNCNYIYLNAGGSPSGFTPAYYTRSVTGSFQLPHMIQVQ